MRPLKAIRAYCIGCSGGSRSEVARCAATDCELYEFRFGRNPRRSGVGSLANVAGNDSRSALESDSIIIEAEQQVQA